MARAPIDDLLHRINNLLGTIQLACLDALRLIAESAERTREEVQRFRNGGGPSLTTPAAR